MTKTENNKIFLKLLFTIFTLIIIGALGYLGKTIVEDHDRLIRIETVLNNHVEQRNSIEARLLSLENRQIDRDRKPGS